MSSRRGDVDRRLVVFLAAMIASVIGIAAGFAVAVHIDDTASIGLPAPQSRQATVAPQPATCPLQWAFSPVDGSDLSMVPGEPVVAMSCSGRQRDVHTGSELTQLVHLLNSRRHIDPNDCIHNLGGVDLDMTQMYFNYPNGDVEVVNFDPNCRTVSNGRLTARFGQVAACGANCTMVVGVIPNVSRSQAP